MSDTRYTYTDYIREDRLPLFYCPGCGSGILFQAVARALAELQIPPQKVVVVCGIGCWGNIDRYFRTNALHGTHGRTLAFATGVKLANPELTVIAVVGDGDGITIGGNHFIQAARRNVDVTCIMLNNQNYGMTGGQVSATTPHGAITSTTKFGNIEYGFNISEVAAACGANYAARTTAYHAPMIQKYIVNGITTKGFSSIEVISPCTAGFDKYNKRGTIPQMYAFLKDHAKPFIKGKSTLDQLGPDEFYVGEIVKNNMPDYSTAYEELRSRVMAERKG